MVSLSVGFLLGVARQSAHAECRDELVLTVCSIDLFGVPVWGHHLQMCRLCSDVGLFSNTCWAVICSNLDRFLSFSAWMGDEAIFHGPQGGRLNSPWAKNEVGVTTQARGNFVVQKHRNPHAWIREQLSKSAHLPDPTHAGTKFPVRGKPLTPTCAQLISYL